MRALLFTYALLAVITGTACFLWSDQMVLWIGAALIVAIITMFIFGAKNDDKSDGAENARKPKFKTMAFAMLCVVCVVLLVAIAIPVKTTPYRVVYNSNGRIVLIDDSGNTKSYDLNKTPHIGDLEVDENVYVTKDAKGVVIITDEAVK